MPSTWTRAGTAAAVALPETVIELTAARVAFVGVAGLRLLSVRRKRAISRRRPSP